MNRTGNTILITGGGTGIGRGLAEAFHRDGNQVVIAGRRQSVLEDTARANPGMRFLTVDVENLDDTKRFGAEVNAQFPTVNVLINNATSFDGCAERCHFKRGQPRAGSKAAVYPGICKK
jgi:uncharacterized oxidoreductase